MKKILCLLFIFISSLSLFSCKSSKSVKNLEISHELEFGGVYLKISIEDFNNKGFEFGDSVDVKFTNGYKVEDIPYYNGYYVDAGETLLVGYPGYDFVKLTLNYGDDYWDIADLDEKDLGSIYLNKKGKYKDIQDTMNIQYKDDRSKYTSDEEFANYREIEVGNIKSNILYRSASPCDNKHKRAHYVDTLMAQDEINFIINLADTKEKIDEYIAMDDFDSPYFLSLYQKQAFLLTASTDEKVFPLAMNMNYKSDEFRGKLALGFKQMLDFEGPYLIHCQEGKDRTGFVCIVVEALCGATYQELVDDYMLTYKNYYGITKESDSLRYNIIKERNVDAMLRFLVGDDKANLDNINFTSYIKNYLKNGGMTEGEINSLITVLTEIDSEKVINNFVNKINDNNYEMKSNHSVLTMCGTDYVNIEYPKTPDMNEVYFTVNNNETFKANYGADSLENITYYSNGLASEATSEITLDYLLEITDNNLMNILYNDQDDPLHFYTTETTRDTIKEFFGKFSGYAPLIQGRIQDFHFYFDKENPTKVKITAEVLDDYNIEYEDIDIEIKFGNAKKNTLVSNWMDNPIYPDAPMDWNYEQLMCINSVYDQQYADKVIIFPNFASYALFMDKYMANENNILYVTDKYATRTNFESYKQTLLDNGFSYNNEKDLYLYLLNSKYDYYASIQLIFNDNDGLTIISKKYFVSPTYNNFNDINSLIQTKDFPSLDQTDVVKSWSGIDEWAKAKVANWYFFDYDLFLDITIQYDDLEALTAYINTYITKLTNLEFRYLEGEDYYLSPDELYSFRWADYGNGQAGMLFKHEHRMTTSEINDALDEYRFPTIDFSSIDNYTGRDMTEYTKLMTNTNYNLNLQINIEFDNDNQRDEFLDSYSALLIGYDMSDGGNNTYIFTKGDNELRITTYNDDSNVKLLFLN